MNTIQEDEIRNLQGLRRIAKRKKPKLNVKSMVPLSISLSTGVGEESCDFTLSVSSLDKEVCRKTFDQLYNKLKKDLRPPKSAEVMYR